MCCLLPIEANKDIRIFFTFWWNKDIYIYIYIYIYNHLSKGWGCKSELYYILPSLHPTGLAGVRIWKARTIHDTLVVHAGLSNASTVSPAPATLSTVTVTIYIYLVTLLKYNNYGAVLWLLESHRVYNCTHCKLYAVCDTFLFWGTVFHDSLWKGSW